METRKSIVISKDGNEQTIIMEKVDDTFEMTCVYHKFAEDKNVWQIISCIYQTFAVNSLYFKAAFPKAGYYTALTWEIIGENFSGKVKTLKLPHNDMFHLSPAMWDSFGKACKKMGVKHLHLESNHLYLLVYNEDEFTSFSRALKTAGIKTLYLDDNYFYHLVENKSWPLFCEAIELAGVRFVNIPKKSVNERDSSCYYELSRIAEQNKGIYLSNKNMFTRNNNMNGESTVSAMTFRK